MQYYISDKRPTTLHMVVLQSVELVCFEYIVIRYKFWLVTRGDVRHDLVTDSGPSALRRETHIAAICQSNMSRYRIFFHTLLFLEHKSGRVPLPWLGWYLHLMN